MASFMKMMRLFSEVKDSSFTIVYLGTLVVFKMSTQFIIHKVPMILKSKVQVFSTFSNIVSSLFIMRT